MEIISKEEAKNKNQVWYFTGIECKNKHIDKRYVNTGICYSCKREINKSCNKRNPETLKKISKRAYLKKNKEELNKKSKEWNQKNPEKRKQILYKSNLKYKEKYKEYDRKYQKDKRKDPYKRVSMNMSKGIWECLKKNKNYNTWLSFIDFSIEELIHHLENQFDSKMTWENYGSYWHIDHIKPLSWFDLSKEFKEAWSLKNLQPLEASINLSKCNRYEG